MSQNAFIDHLGPMGFNIFYALIVDLLHEFELGAWKMLFIHLLQIIVAYDKSLIHRLDERYRQTPTFGAATIRKFSSNASEMKCMAARNFEDLLQCSIPVFDSLLPEPHNGIVMQSLFTMAHWHGLAKLRMHSDLTLDIMDEVTSALGQQLRGFKATVCAAYQTRELRQEVEARARHNLKKSGKQPAGKGSSRLAEQGQTGRSMAHGELEHRAPKAWLAFAVSGTKVFIAPIFDISELATSPHAHHHIGLTQKYPVHIGSFLRSHQGDPAVTMYSGVVISYLALPATRDMSMDWVRRQVRETRMIGANTLFVDRDMLMRFHFGLGVGHVYSHHLAPQAAIQQDNIAAQSASTSHVREDDEDARNSGEDDEGEIDNEDDDDENPMVNPAEQWYGSSQESLLEHYEEIIELEFQRAHIFPVNAHNHYMDSAALVDSCLFDNPGLMPNSGDLVGLNDIDFIGYLSVGHGPTLYPLYCRPMLHNALAVHISLYAYVLTSIVHCSVFETEQMAEVPVYVNSFFAVNAQLTLPAKSTRAGPDNRFYVVYDGFYCY
ncbi:hypothetical protein P692DRAFT_20883262 [Suillus brevipes Sb2]|nr:hypothetical protein P692DRAFT_20883262 [Suillus brevipes Sb2]